MRPGMAGVAGRRNQAKSRIASTVIMITALAMPVGAGWAGAGVIDVVGGAERVGPRGSAPLALFDATAGREMLVLRRDASATIVVDAGGRQYLLRGPGRWQFVNDA